MSNYILTASGGCVSVPAPRAEQIRPYDIVESLSKKARFGGHTPDVFYSVAQHSVIVSHIVPPAYALEGLLHDAAEAYVGDVITPVKQLPAMTRYRLEIEAPMEAAVQAWAASWGFPVPAQKSPEVKRADLVALATEKRDLMPYDPNSWPILEGVEPLPDHIKPLEWREARALFARRFEELAT